MFYYVYFIIFRVELFDDIFVFFILNKLCLYLNNRVVRKLYFEFKRNGYRNYDKR